MGNEVMKKLIEEMDWENPLLVLRKRMERDQLLLNAAPEELLVGADMLEEAGLTEAANWIRKIL